MILSPQTTTKSALMLGLGETTDEVIKVFADLRETGCDSIVLGQYLQPSKNQVEVKEFVTPEKFDWYGEKASEAGFTSVVSMPLARSSYKV